MLSSATDSPGDQTDEDLPTIHSCSQGPTRVTLHQKYILLHEKCIETKLLNEI